MKKENILNFLVDYAYEVNTEICDIKQKLKNSLSEELSYEEKRPLYKRMHEIEGIIEAIDKFITYVKRYPNDERDFDETLNKAKNCAHEAMSKLGAKNINEEVKQAIINAYIKGIEE